MFGFRRLTAFLGVVGLAMVFALDGYSFGVSYPGGAHVTMHPLLLAAWPLVFVSVLVSLTADAQTGGHPAHWSRRITACVIDGGTFAHCLFVPYALLVLVCEVGGMPPPWESARSESSLIDSVYILLFLPLFFALWAGLGLALHPRVTTPGALVCNITLGTAKPESVKRLATQGLFAYFRIPFFASSDDRILATQAIRERKANS
jgi:hypothetical protein